MIASLPPPALRGTTAAQLAAYFENTWQLYETLFASVHDPALYTAPEPLRNPLIFYLGHTAAFYVNKLRLAGLWTSGVNAKLDTLFAVGVDPAHAGDLSQSELWPTADEVRRYRAEVYGRVSSFINGLKVPAEITWQHPLWALFMALEHDRIHLETTMMIVRRAPVNALTAPAGWRYAQDDPAPDPRWIEVAGREISLGRGPTDGQTLYGWDNEYGRLTTSVPPFRASADLVTNAEFLEFVRAGGYAEPSLWTEVGWAWRQTEGVRLPPYWRLEDGEVRYRAMYDELDLPLSWPAEVNAHEAAAFCRWQGSRLMTEAEYAAMAADAPLLDDDAIGHPHYNLDLRYGSPTPVGALGRGPSGFSDVYGNVWQWLADDFRPLPGFEPHPYYVDYSTLVFTPDHAAMRGGAWASTGASASRWFRSWYRRCYYLDAGFRPVKPA